MESDESEPIDVRALAKKRYETYLLQKKAHEELERLGLNNSEEPRNSKRQSDSSVSTMAPIAPANNKSQQQSQGIDKQSILTELTMKITERFLREQRSQQQQLDGGLKGKSNNNSSSGNSHSNNVLELKISKEIENCTCPICYELMVPPNNQPMIIFPCGHTFCKLCLMPKHRTEKLTKCPFCRKPFTSHAPNIHLQNIICAYTDTKHLLDEEELQAAQVENNKLNNNKGNQNSNSSKKGESNSQIDGQSYADNLKLYSLRCTILEQEKAEIVQHQAKAKEQMATFTSVISSLSKQKIQVQQQLLKLQQEQLLIEEFINENQAQADKQSEIVQADSQKLTLIDQTLIPLQQERQKYLILSSDH